MNDNMTETRAISKQGSKEDEPNISNSFYIDQNHMVNQHHEQIINIVPDPQHMTYSNLNPSKENLSELEQIEKSYGNRVHTLIK